MHARFMCQGTRDPVCATCGARVRIARAVKRKKEGARGAPYMRVCRACLRWHPYNETIDFGRTGYPGERAMDDARQEERIVVATR